MLYLLLVSILWGFSFGLIKAEVSTLHPILVSFIRLSLAFLVFVPFLRPAPKRKALQLMGIGFIQFGLMYCLYIWAYQFLQGHEIAILTITTPLFVVLLDAVWTQNLRWRNWAAASLALAGGGALVWQKADGKELSLALFGVFLIQTANLCFASGQVLYKRWQESPKAQSDHKNFAWLYLGGLSAPAIYLLISIGFDSSANYVWPAKPSQWWALLYLGLIPSGLGFFLWNKGVTKVSYGTVAVMNNFKIPAAVLVAWLIFSESLEWVAVISSLAFLAAGNWVAQSEPQS